MDIKLILANQKGAALLFMLIITAFVALTGMSFLNMVINGGKKDGQHLAQAQTLYLAKAGVEKATWLLKNTVKPLPTSQIIFGSLETGKYKINLTPHRSSQGKQIIEGEVEGWKSEASKKIRVTWELVYEPGPVKATVIGWR